MVSTGVSQLIDSYQRAERRLKELQKEKNESDKHFEFRTRQTTAEFLSLQEDGKRITIKTQEDITALVAAGIMEQPTTRPPAENPVMYSWVTFASPTGCRCPARMVGAGAW